MKNILQIAALVGMANLLSSCEETISLDLKQTQATVVIEGVVTNEAGKNYVKISRTAGFYETGPTAKVTNAIVKVSSDKGEETLFAHNPSGDKKLEGIYFTNSTFKGEVGQMYKLTVTIGSQVYEAKDELMAIAPIDSLGYDINDEENKDPEVEGRIYEALLFVKEPQATKDYYLFKFYRNDTLTYTDETDIYFANDEGIGENIEGFPSPVYYSLKDTATVEMYSLSRDAFLFFNDMSNLMNGDGGMFSPPPANPRTNWNNGALGFFQTSAVSRKSIIIKGKE